MIGKNFSDLKEGDIVYAISMQESETVEAYGSCLRKLEVDTVSHTTDVMRIQVRTKGGTFFVVNPNVNSYVKKEFDGDEVDLTFDVYATTKEKAMKEAQSLISTRLRTLDSIKKRIAESETGLLLAYASLDVLSQQEEEVDFEEFASMALC